MLMAKHRCRRAGLRYTMALKEIEAEQSHMLVQDRYIQSSCLVTCPQASPENHSEHETWLKTIASRDHDWKKLTA